MCQATHLIGCRAGGLWVCTYARVGVCNLDSCMSVGVRLTVSLVCLLLEATGRIACQRFSIVRPRVIVLCGKDSVCSPSALRVCVCMCVCTCGWYAGNWGLVCASVISWPFLLDWHVLYNASGSAVLAAGVLIHSCVHHDRRGVVCYAVLCCTVSHGGHWRLHGWCATTRLVGVSVIQADCIVGMLACWSVSFSQMPTERACRRAFMCATVVAVLEGCDRMVVLTACALASISTRVCVCVCLGVDWQAASVSTRSSWEAGGSGS